jgi:uncharacterized protein (TIGR03437 family)
VTVSQNGQTKLAMNSCNFCGLKGGAFFTDPYLYVIAQHASDLALVTPENPAHAGESIIVYGDDFFQVWPPPPIGFPTPPQPVFQTDAALFVSLPNLYLGGYGGASTCCSTRSPALQVVSAVLAPGLVGVEQFKIVIPTGLEPALNWPLFFYAPGSKPCPFGACGEYQSPLAYLPIGH